jgi:AraC family transcriptional regulator
MRNLVGYFNFRQPHHETVRMEKKPDLKSLEEAATGMDLATAEGYSVSQVYRRFKAQSGASPMAVRRKLLLERAAWALQRTSQSVGEIAMDARFETPDGFTRAFRSAYGIGPRDWKRLGAEDYRIGGPGGIHFHPSDGINSPANKEKPMQLFEQMMDDHRAETHRLIDLAYAATGREKPVANLDPFPWCGTDLSVQDLIERCALYGEPWLHALKQIKFGEKPVSAEEFHRRLDQNHEAILALFKEVEADGAWDLTFVDADCTPPEVFSYGFVLKHLLALNAHQRISLAIQLRALGIDAGIGDQPARA